MKKKLLVAGLVLAVFFTFLAGCGDTNGAGEQTAGLDEKVEEILEPEVDETIAVTDQMGREVVLEGAPARIVSLSPSNTEVAFALGLGDRLVGVTDFCNYPPEAEEKESIGGFAGPNIERIVELEPGLVLASTIHREEVPRLEELGLAVLVVESATLIELYASISLIAEITGVEAAGQSLIASMQSRIAAVEDIVGTVDPGERIPVYYEVYSDPLMSAGRDTFINEIITLAGGTNIFGDVEESYPQISAEVVAERQPMVIFFPDYHGTADLVFDNMAGRPGWESVPAVINNRIYAISDDTFARPGPRVVEAIEEAARLLYPDLF